MGFWYFTSPRVGARGGAELEVGGEAGVTEGVVEVSVAVVTDGPGVVLVCVNEHAGHGVHGGSARGQHCLHS